MSLTKATYSMISGAPLNILDFGADPTGVTDSAAAIQSAIDAASTSSKSVYIPDGTFLLDAITYIQPSASYAQRGQNIFGLLFVKSNVTVFGNGQTSVLKVANNQLVKQFTYTADSNSGTYANYAMPGTKGFQVFAQNPSDTLIENFALADIKIDLNGYNNKVYAVNSFGNQSQCSAINLIAADTVTVDSVIFVDCPGTQVISLPTNTSNVTIKNCRFIDCGFLDGTNTALIDHSTIYNEGSNLLINNNVLTQSVQWTGRGGVAFDINGSATVTNNYVSKYLAFGTAAALIGNASATYKGNTGVSITALGFELYNASNNSLDVKILDNSIETTKVALSNTVPSYIYRNFVATGPVGNNPGTTNLQIIGNRISCVGAVGWATDAEDLYNAAFDLRLLSTVNISGNDITGFRGAVFNLGRQKSGSSSIAFENNVVSSCGRKETYTTLNSFVNYTNDNDTSYGNTLAVFASKNNVLNGCVYASYFSFTGVAAGALVTPGTIQIDGDKLDTWMTTLITNGVNDLPSASSAYRWYFLYSCLDDIDATQALKVFPSGSFEYNEAQSGRISLPNSGGLGQGTFEKINGVTTWIYSSLKFGDSAPSIAAEISPFGAQIGDTVKIINAAAGGRAGYYCVTAGTPGTWKSYGAIAS